MIVASLLLILVAVVLLVLGLADGSSTLLISSIAASVLAAVALVTGARQAAATRAATAGAGSRDRAPRAPRTAAPPAPGGSGREIPVQHVRTTFGTGGDGRRQPPGPPVTADVANRTDPADDGPRPFPAAAGSAPDSRPAPARDSEESRPTPGAALREPDGGPTTTAPAATAGGPGEMATAESVGPGTGRAWPPTTGSSWERDAGTPWEPETETPWVPEAETPWTPDAEPPWDDADPAPTTGGGWRDEPDVQRVRPADAARLERLDAEVQVIDGRPRYHLFSCVHLIGREHEALPVSEAVSLGFTPCARCAPATTLLADAFPG